VANGKATRVGALPSAQRMQLTMMLPLRNQAAGTNLLSQLYDPTSPEYHHFLTVQQFTDQFGPTQQDYDSVIKYAQSNGFTIIGQSKNRLTLDVSGTVGQINKAFHVSMNLYRVPNGKRTFYSIDREPTLDLSVQIAHIEGLDDYSVPHPMVHIKKNASPVAKEALKNGEL
jgi:subtilase family serine protease